MSEKGLSRVWSPSRWPVSSTAESPAAYIMAFPLRVTEPPDSNVPVISPLKVKSRWPGTVEPLTTKGTPSPLGGSKGTCAIAPTAALTGVGLVSWRM
jgi:hypothetical protein